MVQYIPSPKSEVRHRIGEFGVDFAIFQESFRFEDVGIGVIFIVSQDRPKITFTLDRRESTRIPTHQILAKTKDPFGMKYPLYSSSMVSLWARPAE